MNNWFIQFMNIIFRNGWTYIGFIVIFCLILSFICEIIQSICEVKKKKYECKSYQAMEKTIASFAKNPEVLNAVKGDENNDETSNV